MITLTNEDNMELMSRYADKHFDLAIVDPPYGIDIAKWDNITSRPKLEYFNELFRVSKNQIIWGGNYFTDKLKITESWICWYKKPFLKQQSHFELAWTSFEMKPKLIEYTYAGNVEGLNNIKVNYTKKSIHPTEKPVNLYKLLLQDYAKSGDKILDTHLGSGSIAIACHDYGFDLTACELDTEYYKAAIKRYKTHIQQIKLF
jgi:site-specific DNA-methyltransferase (adenine-specific)